MKYTKYMSIALLILMLPSFLWLIFITTICMEFWFNSGSLLSRLMNGELNNSLVSIIGVCTILFMAISAMFFMETFRYGDKIDSLDDEKHKFREARRIYERKTNEFARRFLNKK